ncbi:hypothetical protein F5Y14DRAFT_415710 [Nemania sp. NC0429]|nr:hypothetical protein F5Y14DRAFT_415710 [Nemania sp. NC0429]
MAAEDDVVAWQAAPGRRSTLMIIENCLFTIIACTWSIQHLNVQGPAETWWQTFPRKCKWTAFSVFFPEVLMAHAILEFVMAVGDMRILSKEGLLDDDPPWFFRYLRRPPSPRDMEASQYNSLSRFRQPEQKDVPKWTLTHCYFANMGGFYMRDDVSRSSTLNDGSSTTPPAPITTTKQPVRLMTTRHFVEYREYIDIPKLSEDDLKDKSKTDYFTKGIAVLQISQLLLSLIVRHVRRLEFSQLEALTLPFAICGILTYICAWYKPQNVQRPIEVTLRHLDDVPGPKMQGRTFDSLWRILTNSEAKGDRLLPERIPNDNIPRSNEHETHYALYVLTALTAGFGSLHAVAWNFEFPTFTEQLLWKIATLVSTVVPPAVLLVIPLSRITLPWGNTNEFLNHLLSVMREYSWYVANNRQAQHAIKALKEACRDMEIHSHFHDILEDGDNTEDSIVKGLQEYIQQNEELREILPSDFLLQFDQLLEILSGSTNSKRLWQAARTNIYPRRSFFGPFINDDFIYVTSIVYCIARLGIIGIAFSSLRLMPDSVYATTWTDYIPSIQ